MADDTRVTLSRPAFACAFVLFWALACALPTLADAAEIIVRRDAGLSAGQRSDLRADAGVRFARRATLPDSEVVTVPDEREQAALAALNADPDVQYAAANVPLRVASFYPPSDTYYRLGFQRDLEQPND